MSGKRRRSSFSIPMSSRNSPSQAPQAGVEMDRGVPAGRLFLSAVTIGEFQAGIEITRERDEAKAGELETWLCQVVAGYGVLPMDAAAFREWARLKHGKSATLIEDAMIAATARVHRLTVATRNVRDFRDFDVELFDPFEDE